MPLLPDDSDLVPAIRFENPARLRFRLIDDVLGALRDNRLRKALDLITVCCRLPVVAPDDLLLRSEIYQRLGYPRLAAADIAESFAIDPTHPEIAARYLASLIGEKRFDDAERISIQLARLGPELQINAGAIRYLADHQKVDGIALMHAGNLSVRVVVLARTGDERSFGLVMGDQKLVLSCRLSSSHRLSGVLGAAAVLEIPWQPGAETLSVVEDGKLWWRDRAAYRPFFHRHRHAHQALKPEIVQTPLNVIVPVYDGLDETRRCLDALFSQANGKPMRIIIVDDAGPDPAMKSLLSSYARREGALLIENPFNLGFVGSVNRALLLCPRGDILLLNADAILPPGAIGRLSRAAHAEEDIGTVTPLSNNGEFTSFPIPFHPSPCPGTKTIEAIDAVAQRVNDRLIVDLPNGVGFCLYIKDACRQAIGLLNDADFVDGYLEEVDYCLRAAEAGFRNVCACDIYVGHVGGTSFGSRRRDLVMRNIATLQKAFPDIKTRTHSFVQRDPLKKARDALQIELLRGGCFEGGKRSLRVEAPRHESRKDKDTAGTDAIILSVSGKAPTTIGLHAPGAPAPFELRINLPPDNPAGALVELLAPFEVSDIIFDTWDMPEWVGCLPDVMRVPHRVHLTDPRWLDQVQPGQSSPAGRLLATATSVFSVSGSLVTEARSRSIMASLMHLPPPPARMPNVERAQDAPRIAVLAEHHADLRWLKALALKGLALREPLRFVVFSDGLDENELLRTGMVTFADRPALDVAADSFAAFGCAMTIVAFGSELRPGALLSLAPLAPEPCFVDRDNALGLVAHARAGATVVDLGDAEALHSMLWNASVAGTLGASGQGSHSMAPNAEISDELAAL
jgi:GT2 family glycosyltransferase